MGIYGVKRVLVFVLIVFLIGLFAGCGGKSQPSGANPTEAPLSNRSIAAEPAIEAETAESPAPTTPALKPSSQPTPEPTPQPTPEPTPQPGQETDGSGNNEKHSDVRDYVLNMNTMKFHYPSCSSVKDIKDENRWDYTGAREEIIEMGYVPCKKCKP